MTELAPEGVEKPLAPSSIEDIKKVTTSEVVELPGFLDGTSFNAKLRRPSILRMAQLGQIPNQLTAAVDELMSGASDVKTPLKDRAEVLALIAETALEDPPWEAVKDVIDSLQLMAIWHWVVNGGKMLEPFREIRRVLATRTVERALEDEAEPTVGD